MTLFDNIKQDGSKANRRRIINVTHQIPFEIHHQPGRTPSPWYFKSRRHHEAMNGGIHSLTEHGTWDIVHIGWIGQIQWHSGEDTMTRLLTEQDKQELRNELWQEHHSIPLFLNAESIQGHYDGYCKTMLWPLLHYIIWNNATDGRLESKQWEIYAAVNQKYSELVIDCYQPEDVVWIHDYHLLLVPRILRIKLPKANIGLFVHSPWPTSEILRCLPKRQEILKGMMGANLVGFQTYGYARHFISTCTRVLGYETTPEGIYDDDGYFCYVGTFPIGINTVKVEQMLAQQHTLNKMKIITDMYPDKKILVARDKIDLVKGVLQKLEAFEKFLYLYPQWRNKVILIQLTDGSATLSKNDDTVKLENKISAMVARINGVYGSLEFTPVYHYHHHVQDDEYHALLSVADAGLITSNRDGINTTAYEYIICQQKRASPLIVSELTGTATSLSSALIVNPWDLSGVAKAIHDALKMSDIEKMARHRQLLYHVKSHTAEFWARSFVKRLMESIELSEQSSNTTLLTGEQLLPRYQKAKKRLICLGYDGILIPRQNRRKIGASIPAKTTLLSLQKLCDDPRNIIWVVSGQDELTLSRSLGSIKGLGLSAENGAFIKYPNSQRWINLMQDVDMEWKNDVIEIFTYYTERTSGSFIEHKRSSITWNYLLADPVYGAFQAKECQNHLEHAILSKLPVELIIGKKKVEIRPRMTNKGEIIKRLLSSNSNTKSSSSSLRATTISPITGSASLDDQVIDFILCCSTSEDMFKAIKKLGRQDAMSVMVGAEEKRKTLATWHLPTADDVKNILLDMANTLDT
ncbi:glycosyltransferase family 20-domain-containing protein [Halteromyces radiatus]|uniref:glycosyltransferase family 20-domain-containing protein n=1 Tax=Halteromyces radiatus TaxID=101107 RepID=UPI0022202A74|nr:glycosyltransferase family 20-domain-containing protein [Halteromyces radiatus]KAI8099768.1 glycosyltransferase family 20-domain-containing protein [Halteromyces radiatus]